MALERTYIINLRREWLKAPRYKRAKKAVRGLKDFLIRHMKQQDESMIKIGPVLNEAVWARGMRNPPHKVKVNVVKEDDGTVKAELFGYKYITKVKKEKKEEGGIAGKLKEAVGLGKEEKEAEAEAAEEKEERKEKAVYKEAKKKEKKPAKKSRKK